MTKYVSTIADLGNGVKLYIDGNSKISRGDNGFESPVPNALSLPHVSSCPGATPTCAGSCYVHGLRRNAPEIWARYVENFRVLKSTYLGDLAVLFGLWIRENCPDGFRWHVSGDVFSKPYARFIGVASYHAEVPCWIYTRSFEFLEPLDCFAPANLTINISADRDNLETARMAASLYRRRLCYMSAEGELPPEPLPKGSVIFPDYPIRKEPPKWGNEAKRMVCPADALGQSERRRCGPCRKCLT